MIFVLIYFIYVLLNGHVFNNYLKAHMEFFAYFEQSVFCLI